jgi:hypothetical protein
MTSRFESLIAYHCAPTLAGIKPSNIFTWRHSDGAATYHLIDRYGKKLAVRGVSVDSLFYCEKYALVFLYSPRLMHQYLSEASVSKFLVGMGYPDCPSIAPRIEHLKSRFSCEGGFPHEIGLFLGYPLEDVDGFIKHGGKCCKCCGEWKVYGDERASKRLFERYSRCRAYFTQKYSEGFDLNDITGAAAVCA